MRNTILNKFILFYVIILLLGFFCVAIASYRIDYKQAVSLTSERMYNQAFSISNNYATYYSGTSRIESLLLQLRTIASYNDSIIMLLNDRGEIILNTDENSSIESDYFTENFDPNMTGKKRYTIGNFYNYFSEDYLTVIVPVSYELSICGYVLMHKSVASVKAELTPIFNTNYFTLVICALLSSIFIWLIYWEVHKPLKEITHAVREFGHGNLKFELKEYNDDEIGRLAAALGYMADELDQLEESQKKFIANVSHDFRSPLTLIKGYFEAILDGTIPHEMQDKYLNIVIFETERLSKLTNNLLTLNNIDPKKSRLNLEPFDINFVIKHTIETFEGTCAKKGIKFDLTFSAKNTIVYADLERINQVVYNLIDNAIKFSHNDSKIYITVNERAEKAFISIKDTGIGIPSDSVGKIWDRFYKTDLSRGKDKKGTGLGLSIVKDIINAHQENIDVISTEGVGTEFTFSLTKYNDKNLTSSHTS